MTNFNIFVRRIEFGMLEIEASTKEEALEQAYEALCEGRTSWGDSFETFWEENDPEPDINDYDKEEN